MINLGLRGRIHACIVNFLADREVYVLTQEGDSPRRTLHCGVPQEVALSLNVLNISLLGILRTLPATVRILMYTGATCAWASARSLRSVRSRKQNYLAPPSLMWTSSLFPSAQFLPMHKSQPQSMASSPGELRLQ